jgi:hypothetical protein
MVSVVFGLCFINKIAIDTGCLILDTGYWILDTGYLILDVGYSILDIGRNLSPLRSFYGTSSTIIL